jgi:radical SAM superfamily enzyme YgiQ (UPF0313 family)
MRYIPETDYVCAGEAEMVLPEFVRRWRAGEDYGGLKGLGWRDSDQIMFAGVADKCMHLDSTPFPARHLVPNDKYYNFISERRNYTVFNSSRGCPFSCVFCEAAGTKWRARSATNVVDEFEECFEKHGVREIDIFDSSFTINKKRVLDICGQLVARGLSRKIIWNVRSRVDTVDKEMLEALKEAGCYRIFYGVESGNPEILMTLRKSADLKRMEEVIRITDKAGISTFAYFLLGAPGETHETVRQTIGFAKKLPLDFAIFNVLTAFPKTQLYENHYLPYTSHDFWAGYLANPDMVKESAGMPWTKMSEDEIRKLAHNAMIEFYFSPYRIARAIRTVRSADQLKRYCLAGVDMLVSSLKSILRKPTK